MVEIKNTKTKRNSREIKLDLESDNFKGIFGSTNKYEPNVIYIKLTTWMNHTEPIYNYPSNMEQLNKKIKIKFGEYVKDTNSFVSKVFYNLDTKTVLVKEDDCFHGSFEFTIKQVEPTEVDMEKIKPVIEKLCNKIINSMEISSNFSFRLTKK